MVRSSDTDVLVIIIGLLGKQGYTDTISSQVIMDCGAGNNRRYINVSEIVKTLEEKTPGLAESLPGFHSFTGCDYTSAFYKKGKIKPFAILEKNASGEYIRCFKSLGMQRDPDINLLNRFVCEMYSCSGMSCVNDARCAIFKRMSGPKDLKNPLGKIKRIDCAVLSPCSKTLDKKIMRCHYVSVMWSKAGCSNPLDGMSDPTKFGWKMENEYVPEWFSGTSVPSAISNTDVQPKADDSINSDVLEEPDLSDE